MFKKNEVISVYGAGWSKNKSKFWHPGGGELNKKGKWNAVFIAKHEESHIEVRFGHENFIVNKKQCRKRIIIKKYQVTKPELSQAFSKTFGSLPKTFEIFCAYMGIK